MDWGLALRPVGLFSQWLLSFRAQRGWTVLLLGLVACGRTASVDTRDTAGTPGPTGDSVGGEVEVEAVESPPLPTVVINELHYDPDDKTEPVEFIELVNWEEEPVDLSGWSICDGVDLVLEEGTVLEPEQHLVVAQDPEALVARYSRVEAEVQGPWSGRLGNGGEVIALCDRGGEAVDQVHYKLGFPWPTVGDRIPDDLTGTGHSAQLAHPALDNALGGSWRSAEPSPGRPNEGVLAADMPPQIREVAHDPLQPTASEAVLVTARVSDPQGVAAVTLHLQVVEPGNYVRHEHTVGSNTRIPDPAYEEGWTDWEMNDEGRNGDAVPADGVYTVQIQESEQKHRHLMRYRITITDVGGLSVRVPYADDPQPNFAWFVYDGVPAWTGADKPGVTPEVTYDAEVMNSLPVYHLIARPEDVMACQYDYIDYMSEEAGWYQWTGALVYEGVVYDHIWFRTRGWWSAYEWGKNKWKFDFQRGHDFQARDNEGALYLEAWDKMNFSSCITPVDYSPHRGEQGLFEAMTYRLFQLMEVPAPDTHWLHFRIIDGADESTDSQHEGDFWGLYQAIEQPDGNFLDARGLPDGNVYKMAGTTPVEWTSGTNQGPTQVDDMSDLWTFINTYQASPDKDWWEENAALETYVSYRAVVDAVHHYDIPDGWNSVYYHHPETDDRQDHWWMLPWDVDLTWDCCIYQNDGEQFSQVISRFPEWEIAYNNRMREFGDLLFNDDQGHQLLDELAAVIHQSGAGASFAAADRALWDHHPRNTRQGVFYVNPAGDLSDMVGYMKSFMDPGGWGGSSVASVAFDSWIPETAQVTAVGSSDFPVDDLVFQASDFADPQGVETFSAMAWRVGEVGPGVQEIEEVWESGVLTDPESLVTIPATAVEVGRRYRVRVRYRDTSGRWSHWSEPVEFEPN